MKTRLEILESHHDSALAQLVENEINVQSIEQKIITTVPGAEYNEMVKVLSSKKANVEQIKKVLSNIEEMIFKEKKACQTLN
jgi:hypothetical protein